MLLWSFVFQLFMRLCNMAWTSSYDLSNLSWISWFMYRHLTEKSNQPLVSSDDPIESFFINRAFLYLLLYSPISYDGPLSSDLCPLSSVICPLS
jgi:hypothetical protein